MILTLLLSPPALLIEILGGAIAAATSVAFLIHNSGGLSKVLKETTEPVAATPWAPPAPAPPKLWTPGCSAFWLDPDLWYGVGDTHAEMCWMHLEERPARRAQQPWDRPSVPNTYTDLDLIRTEPKTERGREIRDAALAMLVEAKDYDRRGFPSLAGLRRSNAMMLLRNMRIRESEGFYKIHRPQSYVKMEGSTR